MAELLEVELLEVELPLLPEVEELELSDPEGLEDVEESEVLEALEVEVEVEGPEEELDEEPPSLPFLSG